MKNDLIFLIIFITSILNSITAQKCLVEGIKFESQEQIDDFSINHSGCSEIIGDVLIESDNSENIYNLNGLSEITFIGGFLKIRKNDSLKTLSGLKNLISIGENIDVTLNNSLTSLEGLENLSFIPGYLKIDYNSSLTSLSGLDNIESIQNNLSIRSNSALLSLNGLEKLDSVKGIFGIISNVLIPNLNGLNNLNFIGKSLSINNNNLLTSLQGLENLNSVGGPLDIYNNNSLVDFTQVENLIREAEQLEIQKIAAAKVNAELEAERKAEAEAERKAEADVESEAESKERAMAIAMAIAHARAQAKTESKDDSQKMGNTNGTTNYNAWITLIEKPSNFNGYLREVKDSAMVFSNYFNKLEPNYKIKNIEVENIETCKFRKEGSAGKSLIIGVLTGLGIGALLGYAAGDSKKKKSSGFDIEIDFTPQSAKGKAVFGGVLGSFFGGIIGLSIGTGKIEIPIKGDQNLFKIQKEKLMKFKTF